MIRGCCPICSKQFEVVSLDELPSFPFCSERCRMVDLGRWIDGAYVVPGVEGHAPSKEEGMIEADDEGE
jgi:hypothetical protein